MVTKENFINLNKNFYTKCKSKARIFNLLTLPTFIFAVVVACYLRYLPLKIELHSVILIGFIYFIYLFFVRHNAYYVSCKFKTQYKQLVDSLIKYINDNLLTIGETTKANGNVDDFLQEFTSNIRNTNFSSIASSIFPTLGILGTFISIAFSMPDFSSGTSSALEKEISLLLGGVGTAFYVSIYGIFLSLWWIFFEKIGMSRFEHDTFVIKENTKTFFWTKLDIESIHLQSSMRNFDKMNYLFEQIASKNLLDDINKSLERRASIVESIIQEEKILVHSLRTNIENIEKLFDMIKVMTFNIESNIDNYKMQGELQLQSTSLLNENIKELNTVLLKLDKTNIEEVYTNVLKNIDTMKNETDRIGWSFNKKLDEYDSKLSDKLNNSLEAIDTQTVKIIEDLKEFRELNK